MTQKELGGVGTARKVIGFIILIIFAIVGLLDGFDFYQPQSTVFWGLGVIGLGLMIAGIAKDVVAIAKNVLK